MSRKGHIKDTSVSLTKGLGNQRDPVMVYTYDLLVQGQKRWQRQHRDLKDDLATAYQVS